MRALTLTQPWSGLVASGIKRIENRSRLMIRREDFGIPFAIHASRVIDLDVYGRIEAIAPELAGAHQPWRALSLYTSAVIGVATIDRVLRARDGHQGVLLAIDATAREVDLGDQARWFFGPVGYVLRDIRALTKPVACRGWQGFWTLPNDVEGAVVEQLA